MIFMAHEESFLLSLVGLALLILALPVLFFSIIFLSGSGVILLLFKLPIISLLAFLQPVIMEAVKYSVIGGIASLVLSIIGLKLVIDNENILTKGVVILFGLFGIIAGIILVINVELFPLSTAGGAALIALGGILFEAGTEMEFFGPLSKVTNAIRG